MFLKNEEIQKIHNYDNVTGENITKQNLNWTCIPDHLFRLLIIGGSESGKTNAYSI